jgi:hypothetical protein
MATIEPPDTPATPQPPTVASGGMAPGSLPLPDPYPEYLACPHCGEPEVEVWCYQAGGHCHACGGWVDSPRPPCFGSSPLCKGAAGGR